jgi:hypothetical protein
VSVQALDNGPHEEGEDVARKENLVQKAFCTGWKKKHGLKTGFYEHSRQGIWFWRIFSYFKGKSSFYSSFKAQKYALLSLLAMHSLVLVIPSFELNKI